METMIITIALSISLLWVYTFYQMKVALRDAKRAESKYMKAEKAAKQRIKELETYLSMSKDELD